jgi:hypothetical protein
VPADPARARGPRRQPGPRHRRRAGLCPYTSRRARSATTSPRSCRSSTPATGGRRSGWPRSGAGCSRARWSLRGS